MRPLYRAAALAAALWAAPAAFGAEYPFGYVYTTDTQPKGHLEVEQWVTNLRGQAQGDYSAFMNRTELEYGVTDNFQASVYFNYGSVSASGNNPDGTTGGRFVPDAADPNSPYSNRFYDSTSLEFIWRVLSPYKDFMGVALYLEPTYGPKKKEIEAKLILDKNFLEDRLVWAVNFVVAHEQEKYPGIWEKEAEQQVLTGLSYRFAPKWSAAVEYRWVRGFEGNSFAANRREYSHQSLGPSLHYADKRWWVTLTWLPQLTGARAYNTEAAEHIVDGRIYGEAAARREIRLRVGLSF